MVVITGGEPLLHNLTTLCMALKEKGISTHLETSGTQPLSGLWDWITLSPKQHAPPLDSIFSSVNELKIVLTNANDILWAEKNAALCSPHCRLFLQPEWSNRKIALPIILEYIKQHPQWRLSVQLHKIIGVP